MGPSPTPTRAARRPGGPPPTTPTPGPTIQPGVVPSLSDWEAHMTTYGRQHCEELRNSSFSAEELLAGTYYDAEWVFYQIGDYTRDSYWYNCAQVAEAIYREDYVVPYSGIVPGYWNFTHGVAEDYRRTGDLASRNAVVALSENASYAPDWTPLEWTADATLSREVAYAIMSYLNAELVGQPHRPRTEQLVNQALSHMDQWFVSRTAEYVRPFMFSLTAHALISYDAQIGGDSRILPAIRTGADWIWDHTWLPAHQSFMYTDKVVSSGGTDPSPDLSLLIAPVYAWLWHQTGDPIYRDRADLIFVGGVNGAWLSHGKQFNQSYRWSFDFVRYRAAPPVQ